LEASQYFWTNNDVLSHPKVRTIIDDGRNFVMASREQYDVIVLEPPETFTAGVINLYTREFYRDAAACLAPDGLMLQWLPHAEAPLDEERMLFRAFYDVFPHATAWWELDGWCILLIGGREPLTIDYTLLKQKMQSPRVRRDLELAGVRGVDHLLSFFVFDEAAFSEFVRGVPPATDEHTVLDFTMPRFLGSGFGLGQMSVAARQDGRGAMNLIRERVLYYLANRRPIVPYLRNLGRDTPAAIEARVVARRRGGVKHRRFTEAQWRRW
jgi:hypothetical protein